jgi:subtilase family serine protease
VTDTVLNQGQVATAASTTRYYLSSNGTAKTKLLTGTRPIPPLNPAGTLTGTATVTVPPNTVLGSYYLLACADDTTNVPESNEGNNCRASATTVQVTRPDLLATAVTFDLQAVLPGTVLSVTDTIVNQGLVDAGASTTRYYLSADTVKDTGDRLLSGTRSVPTLGPNAASTGPAAVTVPTNMPLGSYFLLACADDTTSVTETSEANNCIASSTSLRVGRPDLRETMVSNPPTLALPGSNFAVTDMAVNQGDIPAAATTTRYYLSADQVRNAGDQLLSGTRSVPALASNETSNGGVTVTIPNGTDLGMYYLLACADDMAPKVTEADETNNCLASATTIQITRPDLVETTISNPPATAALRSGFSVNDTVANQGLLGAGASTTRYYLSVDTTRDNGDKRLTGTRAVPALGPNGSSTGATTVTIPANTVLGTYYLLACADDMTDVSETDETNNCIASTTTVTITP